VTNNRNKYSVINYRGHAVRGQAYIARLSEERWDRQTDRQTDGLQTPESVALR